MFIIETAVVLLKNIFEFTLIRLEQLEGGLEGFNNKISLKLHVCSTWPSGKAFSPVCRRSGVRFRI